MPRLPQEASPVSWLAMPGWSVVYAGTDCVTPVHRTMTVRVDAPVINPMAELLRSSGSFDEWDRKEGTPGPMGVTWVPTWAPGISRSTPGALPASRCCSTAHEDPVHPIFEVPPGPARQQIRAESGTAGLPPIAPPARLITPIASRAATIPPKGYRFDPQKILLDPFAPAVYFPPDYNRIAAGLPGPNDGRAPLGVLPADRRPIQRLVERPTRAQPRSDRVRTARQGIHRAG